MTRRDDPVPLRDALAAVGRGLGIPAREGVDALLERWPEIVGADVAPHARVGSLRDGVCTIVVDGPAWATQLRYRARELATRVEECCGAGSAGVVRVVVAGPGKAR